MWTQSHMFIAVFLFVYLFEPSTSSGRVSVHLLEYHRSSDAGCKEGGYYKAHPCDPQFTFCLKGLSPEASCTDWSHQYHETRDVIFEKNINGGIANPIVKSFAALQTGAVFEVKVGDYFWMTTIPIPLEDWKTPVPPSHNGANVTLTNSNAKLTLTITVTCDPHYYGPNCSALCNPGSADHYTCGPDGSKQCIKGYTGSSCQQTLCHNVTCHNGGKCVVVGSAFNCSCPSGYNGPLCETTPCTKNPCQNQGTCHFSVSKATCSCSPGYNGMYCEVTPSMTASSTDWTLSHLPTPTGCPHNISNCEFAECPDLTSARCVRCRAGYTEVEGRCMTCPTRTPILHCEEEQSVGCLFRWCNRCEQGFYREASACEVCPRLHAGCRDHVCSSADDVICVRCHPGFFLAGNTCKECPSPNPMCDEFTCSDSNDVTCTKCKDGSLEVDGQCLLCPSTSLIPDCVDVARDSCFKNWCRKCAPGFFISGTACDVCPPPGVGCQLAECNSTQDSRCVTCFHGYDLKGGICTHSHGNASATTLTQCVDNPHVNCASLHSSINVCSEPTTACKYCPRYCNMCNTCTQGVPIIG